VNTLLHREGDDDLDDLNGTKDREITLGTTMILGIFFALAVLCAVFFGFGYQLGRKSVVTTPAPVVATTQSTPNFAGFKPAAGSLAAGAPDKTSGQTIAIPTAPSPTAESHEPQAATESNDDTPDSPVAPSAATTARPQPATTTTSSSASATPAPTGAGAIVQIAAVSHQEDADLLVSTLKRRGYSVAIHSEPQDKLLHVQIGPFASHKDADAMRQRLLADGFNAIVKDPK
jgi:cell division septation protein DedD